MSEDKKYVEEMEPESTDTEVNETMSLELDKTIQTYEKKLSDYDEKLQRALADYQNLERRTKVEISQRVSSKTNDLLLNFINIYEDFIRAEKSLSNEKIDTTGIIAVIKNMENILAENNISVFVLSTYDTDYILIKSERFKNALHALGESGYHIN